MAGSGIGSLHACRPGGQQYRRGEAQRPAQSGPVDGSGMQRDHSTRTVVLGGWTSLRCLGFDHDQPSRESS
jgi:hypothetical protein